MRVLIPRYFDIWHNSHKQNVISLNRMPHDIATPSLFCAVPAPRKITNKAFCKPHATTVLCERHIVLVTGYDACLSLWL
jgi:hypothetical protein